MIGRGVDLKLEWLDCAICLALVSFHSISPTLAHIFGAGSNAIIIAAVARSGSCNLIEPFLGRARSISNRNPTNHKRFRTE